MSPWVAGIAFGLGVGVGLYWAHEADEALHLHVTTRLEVLANERDICRKDLDTALSLVDSQQGILERQLRVLSQICPVMRRAMAPWPWCPPEEAEVVR